MTRRYEIVQYVTTYDPDAIEDGEYGSDAYTETETLTFDSLRELVEWARDNLRGELSTCPGSLTAGCWIRASEQDYYSTVRGIEYRGTETSWHVHKLPRLALWTLDRVLSGDRYPRVHGYPRRSVS